MNANQRQKRQVVTGPLPVVVVLVLALSVASTGSAQLNTVAKAPTTLLLARDGATEYVILRPAQPSPAEETASQELASYLKKVTGAEFRVVAEDSAARPAKAIYVGWTAFAAGKGIDGAKLGAEEWVIKTFGADLVITGGRPWGTRWGVFDFLETAVGVHFFDTWSEYVPSRPTLEVAVPDRRVQPAFLSRNFLTHEHPTLDGPLWERYADFNRQALDPNARVWTHGSPLENLSHNFGLYIHPDEYGQEHPEYFAMHRDAGGTLFRNTDDKETKVCWFDLCLSNPDVRRIVIAKLRGHIKADREKAAKEGKTPPFIYALLQNDCLPDYGCLCPECRKIVEREGAESGLMLDFINAIADDIRADFPEILITTYAYNHTLKAPKHIRPRDNVMIMWCDNYGQSDWFRPLTHDVNKDMRDSLESWARIAKNIAVFDYWSILQPHNPGFYIPASSIPCVKRDLDYFLENKVRVIVVCGFPDWMPRDSHFHDEVHSFYALKVWLGCKFLLDPGADEKQLLDTFFAGYYGPAAGKMREFLNYLEGRQNEYPGKLITISRDDYYKAYLDLEFFLAVQPILDVAEAAVAGDPLRLARVKRERIPVDSALLHLEPGLRKVCSTQDRAYPFDRERVLERYAANWAIYLDNFVNTGNREKARALTEKRLDSLRSMSLLPRESFRCWAAPVAESAITIDGVLSEPVWKTVGASSLTPLNKSQELKARTAVRTLWSKDMLYLAFECFDDRIGEMKFVPRKNDDPATWQDSSAEVFLNPSGDCKTYYQLVVNPAAAVLDIALQTLEGQRKADDSWSSGAKVAAKVNPDSWVVELAVPFRAVGFEPKPRAAIVANFCRSRYLKNDAEASQLTTWSPFLNVQFHEPDRFGYLVLASGAEELLASFEGPQDTPAIARTNNGCLAGVSQERDRASNGQASLRVEFPPTEQEKDLGITLDCGELTDWTTFSRLMADIYLEGEDPVNGTLIRLVGNNSRSLSYGTFNLKPGWNKDVLLFDLLDPRAKLGHADLSNVRQIHTYTYWPEVKHPQPLVIFIDSIRLVRKQDGGER